MEENSNGFKDENEISGSNQQMPNVPKIDDNLDGPRIENNQENQSNTNGNSNTENTQNINENKINIPPNGFASGQSSNNNTTNGQNFNNGQINNNSAQNPYQYQQNVPNSVAILILGILSIISLCCCGAVLSPIFSIIALVMSSKSLKIYRSNPERYTLSSYKNINAGRICAIIGLVLAIILIVILIVNLINNSEFYYKFTKVINETWDQTTY